MIVSPLVAIIVIIVNIIMILVMVESWLIQIISEGGENAKYTSCFQFNQRRHHLAAKCKEV